VHAKIRSVDSQSEELRVRFEQANTDVEGHSANLFHNSDRIVVADG
jgi:hypothetical protein